VSPLNRFNPCHLSLWLACSSMGVCSAAEVAEDRQAQMAAAYVFNFAKFVEWPASAPSDTLEVCFVGAANVRDALASSTVEKKAGARRIVVRDAQTSQSLTTCQVVYIGDRTRDIPTQYAALTIGDSEDLTRLGGIIRLYTESNRLRFIINVDNAKRAGLQISSNLLKLATRIEQGAPQ
jgi:hypothetical protein